MKFIKKMIEKHKEKVKQRNDCCNNLISNMENAINEAHKITEITTEFVDASEETKWKSKYDNIPTKTDYPKMHKAKNYKILLQKTKEFQKTSDSLKTTIANHNNKIAENKINDAYNLIGNIEGRKLDAQQMLCIVKENYNHLVIAGAGTGKTTTIIGKIKYLLKTNKYTPNDILALSFTNKSAAEMKERIKKETGYDIDASTFHKLGLNILTKVNEKVPKITKINLYKFIKEKLLTYIENEDYLKLLNKYFLYNYVNAKSEFEFTNEQEYEEYLKINPPTTIKNEMVKSYGEMDIANFLNENNINYIYEHPYKIDVSNSEYGQYKPDFYLPDYDIYIEYFSINKEGKVPTYFKVSHNKTATERYHELIKWKEKIHKDNNTKMIECYAYEKFDGNLLKNLKNKLLKNNINLNPKSSEELWKDINNSNPSLIDGITELFQTIINLIKSNNYQISYIKNITTNKNDILTLNLVEPIYNAYNSYLSENEEIDFNDMINLAANYIEEGKYTNTYKYVIIDEYQDIAKSRYNLIKALRKSNDFQLFCVGDDWQSIYRFAGSDIDYILNFESYWGASEISKIETTYRFPQSLIDISSWFIMKNPNQIVKNIHGKTTNNFALEEINGYTEEYAIKFMTEKLDELPQNSTIFFIGRYLFDIDILKDNSAFTYHYNTPENTVIIKYHKRLDLKIEFITAHKSKGLQADYVFVINNKKGKLGFPSKIQDANILNLLLNNNDYYPNAEERRLFYVALTRAKNKVYLLTIKNKESEFVTELQRKFETELRREKFTCPQCGGKLIIINGQYGKFLGCSNYSKTGCNYTKKINKNI